MEMMSKTGIRNWPTSERPRETLIEKGSSAVSDAGLVAVLLRSGSKGEDAVALARNLIKKFGGLGPLLHASKQELEKIRGLGPAKIAVIMAAMELARRMANESMLGMECLNSDEEVFRYLKDSMKGLKKEVFKVLYLNNTNRIVAVENLFEGTVDQSIIYPREVIKRALEIGATGIICAHNHPAGDPKPSGHDIELTRKLFRACEAVDIRPLDHIIVAGESYVSVKEVLEESK